MGPRATSAFLVLTGLLFALFLGALAWRGSAGGGATWLLPVGVIVAVSGLVLAILFARGVGEGRL